MQIAGIHKPARWRYTIQQTKTRVAREKLSMTSSVKSKVKDLDAEALDKEKNHLKKYDDGPGA